MASIQAARTDTIIIMVDGDELKLSVTTRAPIPEQPNPPTESQLARIRTGCVMQYTTNYRKAISGEWTMETFDPDLKSPIRYVAENSEDNQQIQPSIADPYVTVWQMGNWGSNNPPSLTLHDYDSGNTILQLSAICETSNDKLREVFNTGSGIKGMQLLYISSFKRFPQEHSNDTVNPPTPENTNRIGRNENSSRIGRSADSLPDTPKTGDYTHATNAFIRNTKIGQFEGSISLEAGKTDSPNFKTQARLADKPFDAKAVQYPHGALVAYPLIGFLTVGDWNGTRYVDMPFGNSKYRQFDDSDKQYPVWKELQNKLAIADENLVAGLKIEVSADYVVIKCNSEDKNGTQLLDKDKNPIQYKQFYGFFRKDNSTKEQVSKRNDDQSHQDWDTFNPESSSDYRLPDNQDIPF